MAEKRGDGARLRAYRRGRMMETTGNEQPKIEGASFPLISSPFPARFHVCPKRVGLRFLTVSRPFPFVSHFHGIGRKRETKHTPWAVCQNAKYGRVRPASVVLPAASGNAPPASARRGCGPPADDYSTMLRVLLSEKLPYQVPGCALFLVSDFFSLRKQTWPPRFGERSRTGRSSLPRVRTRRTRNVTISPKTCSALTPHPRLMDIDGQSPPKLPAGTGQ